MAKKATSAPAPMKNIVEAWLSKVELALKAREEAFGQYAEEAELFFDGNHDWMWNDKYARGNGGFLDKEGGVLPNFRISVNKLFEAVALFGPSLYAQNPNALVTPTLPPEVPPEALGLDPNDPYAMSEYMPLAFQEQQRLASKRACASVKSSYLNWLQVETDKKTESRDAITDAIVSGVGYLETVLHHPPGGKIALPRSRHLSWRDVVFDPDAAYYEDVQWIGIRRCRPVNKVERQYGYERGYLNGNLQSLNSQTTSRAKKEGKQNRPGQSFDQIEYWEIYSKNGFGDLLHDGSAIPRLHQFDYSVLGDYCHIACAKGVPHPLNVPTELITGGAPEDLLAAVQWPIPYWYDDGGWPISRLTFYKKPNCIWPISLFKPAIGELRFVNWCLSFLADKVASSCATYVGVLKEAGATIQQQITGNMAPFTIVEIATALGKPLDQIISFLQAPNFSIDIWKMIAEVLDLIDKRTGLTELIYGLTGASMRSATEANIKNQHVAVRPDDMASRVEDWLSEVEVREMQAAQWFLSPQDVEPSVGSLGAIVWQNYIMPADIDDVVRGFDYRIEAGSARKPNKANKAAQIIELGQYMLPVLQEMALAGNVEPWNAYIRDVAKPLDLDATPYLLQPPDPAQQGPSPEQQQLEMKMAELTLKLEGMQAKLGMDSAQFEQEMVHDERRMQMEEEQHDADLKRDKEKAAADMQIAKQRAKAKPKAGAKK